MWVIRNNFDTANCFLHTWKPVKFCRKNIKNKFELLNKKIINNKLSKDSPIEELINRLRKEEIITKTGKKKKKISQEQAKLIKNKYKKTTVEKVMQSIDDLLVKNNSAISRFTIYKYSPDESFCKLGEINKKIYDQLEFHLKYKKLAKDKKIIQRIIFSLLGFLDNHIIKRHETKEILIIPFNDLIKIIDDKNIGDTTIDLLYYEFKNIFHDSLNEFIVNPSLFNNIDRLKYFSKEDSQLEICIEKTFKKSSKYLFKIYLNQSPHIDFNKDKSIINSAIKLGSDGIKNSLLYIYSNIQCNLLTDKDKNRVYYLHKGRYYLPTSISSGDEFDLAKNILNNPHFIENTYDISTLIGGKQCPNISNLKHTLDKYCDDDLEDPLSYKYTSKDRISKICSDLKLTSIENIIGEIND